MTTVRIDGAAGSTRASLAAPGVRADFAQALEQRLSGWVTNALGSAGQAALEPFVEGGRIKVDRLPAEAQTQLAKLQDAAQSMEAYFLKGLLEQTGRERLVEEGGAMGDFARDMMHQAVADHAARGPRGMGLAKLVFLSTAEAVVKGAVSRPNTTRLETEA